MEQGPNDPKGTATPDQSEETQADPIKNLHAEFSRKTSKLTQENLRLSQQLEQVVSLLQQQQAPSKAAASSQSEDGDLEDLAFSNPKAYAQKVTQRATQEASRVVSQQMQQQQQSQAVLNQLVNDYPELSDSNSELTTRAVEFYKQLSEQERTSPSAYKIAVRDAAADLGVLPKSKRKGGGSDDYTMSSSSSSGMSGGKSQNRQRDAEVEQKSLAFAKLLGMDINDKKVVERIKQRSQRKSWGSYE